MQIYNWNELSASSQQRVLQRPQQSLSRELRDTVSAIISHVQAEGDIAIKKLTAQYDCVTLAELQVTPEEFLDAQKNLDSQAKAAINFAFDQIKKVHTVLIPNETKVLKQNGLEITRQIRAIQTVGLYVPGGKAPLISTVLMLGIPATLANCPNIVMCTPPDQHGGINPYLLYAASLCGISQIFKVGGAQAIAAMAYGTKLIPKVDKLFGPGNAWVTEAKTQVAQDPQGASIDMPAGPSEVLVIADENANAEFVAADLLAQAEHSVDAQVILITVAAHIAEKVLWHLHQQHQLLPRHEIISQALQHSRIVVVNDLHQAIKLSNVYAPEHLILHIEDAENYVTHIQNAGSVFLGAWSPETLGDYVTGSNHVLPTYGHAKTYSGLSVSDFIKTMHVQHVTSAGLHDLSSHAVQLAQLEGLQAHAQAVLIRTNNKGI